MADRVSELERQTRYTYLDPDKKHRVSDPTLKAIQKKALLSFYERHHSSKSSWRSEPQLAQPAGPQAPVLPPRPQNQTPSRRASCASDYASSLRKTHLATMHESKTTDNIGKTTDNISHVHSNSIGSLSADLLGPVIMGPAISVDDWVPERPPKKPHLRTVYPDLFRAVSPDLPPPSPPVVLENEVFNDEPLPPPPTEIETETWNKEFNNVGLENYENIKENVNMKRKNEIITSKSCENVCAQVEHKILSEKVQVNGNEVKPQIRQKISLHDNEHRLEKRHSDTNLSQKLSICKEIRLENRLSANILPQKSMPSLDNEIEQKLQNLRQRMSQRNSENDLLTSRQYHVNPQRKSPQRNFDEIKNEQNQVKRSTEIRSSLRIANPKLDFHRSKPESYRQSFSDKRQKLIINGNVALSNFNEPLRSNGNVNESLRSNGQFNESLRVNGNFNEPLKIFKAPMPLPSESRDFKVQRCSIAEENEVAPPPLHPRQGRINQSMRARIPDQKIRKSPEKDDFNM